MISGIQTLFMLMTQLLKIHAVFGLCYMFFVCFFIIVVFSPFNLKLRILKTLLIAPFGIGL